MVDFTGGSANDVFTGSAGNDTILGNGGDDTLNGAGGNDIVVGGDGADTLDGGEGDDRVYSGNWSPDSLVYYPYTPLVLDTGTAVDTLTGGAGNDLLFAGYGDNVDGGADVVTNVSRGDYLFISFQGAPSGVTADFRLGTQVIGGGTITGIEGVALVQGSNFDDDITIGPDSENGYSVDAALYGMGGNDRLIAGWYTRLLDGGEGNDFLDARGSNRIDTVIGGAGNDTIYTNQFRIGVDVDGGSGNDTIFSNSRTRGGSGDDTIVIHSAYARVYGDEGNDDITAGASGSMISGDAGADVLRGNAGTDILASAGITTVRVGLGMSRDIPDWDNGLEHDVLTGGGGDDELTVGYGDDADGGPGTDSLRLSLGGAPAGVSFNSASITSGQPFTLGGGTIQNMEYLIDLRATEYADLLILDRQAAPDYRTLTVDAGAGDDEIRTAGSGSNYIKILGGAGNDILISGTGPDNFDGGDGIDTVDYGNSTTAVIGTNGDTLTRVEIILGSAFGDTLGGHGLIEGRGGDDNLTAYGAGDTLKGGEGNDYLVGQGYNTTYDGGAGSDTVDFSNETGPVAVNLHSTLSLTIGSASTGHPFADGPLAPGKALDSYGRYDTLIGIENLIMTAGNEDIQGSDEANRIEARGGHDRVLAQGGNDVVLGGDGADVVYGGSGNDTLEGGAGQDALYGEDGNDILRGNEGNDLLKGGAGVDSFEGGADDLQPGVVGIWGDVVSFHEDRATQGVVADLRTGSISNDGFGNAETMTGIESIEGDTAFADTFHGNDQRNLLVAGRGDSIFGHGGDDRIELRLAAAQADGGAGTDTLKLRSEGGFLPDSNGDGAAEPSGPGTAGWFVNLASGVLRDGLNNFGTAAGFENVEGSDQNDVITGNVAANILIGLGGDDILNGAGGGDRLEGGLGNDSYTVHSGFDVVVELAGHGSDTVATFVSYTLGDNVENLQAANIAGNAPLTLTGNGLSNFIWGNQGANVINGGGGADRMLGGGGDDIYTIDDAGDIIYEDAGLFAGGTDLAATDISYTLGANVENLQARIIAGNAALSLTGNELNNNIYANQGNNVLNGAAGADFMAGYAGDDFYFVDNNGDRVYEEAGGGTDTVATVISHTLAANVENLQAVNIAGSDPLALTGNDLRNFIWATQGDNVIDGGVGADFMIGYGGNDFYYVDNAGDVAYEEAGGGTDTVATTSDYTLNANVENLQATHIGGTAALSLTGNALNNIIWGTQGNNVIAGGAGIDRLYGYAGADQFLFNTAAGDSNFDYLDDFQAGTDKILLDNSVFTGLADGALPASAFVTGTAALDADDRIIFNSANGGIFYDADGSGAQSAVLIAIVPVGQPLTAADILVV